MRHTTILATIVCLFAPGCGGGAFSPGRVSYEQTAPDQWAVGVEGARAEPSEGVVIDIDALTAERRGDAYAAEVAVGVTKDDVAIDTAASLDLTGIGGDASLSASVDPTEGRSVAIDTTASWASPVADELDGGLMGIKTCAAIGTADTPTELCVSYEAGTMGGQDVACVSYGQGVNLCFPLPDSWRGGSDDDEQGAADIPDGGRAAPDAGTMIDVGALTPPAPALDPPIRTAPGALTPGPILIGDAG